VNTAAARYQNLSINQTKLSGQCGRLKCCLNYELDTYLDALQQFPDRCETIQVAKGNANLIKKDIFKNLMWYVLPDSNKQYPLSIERVKKIKALNAQGTIPDELGAEDLTASKNKEIEPEFVELVGQISLQSLEKADRKRKHKQQDQRSQQRRQQRGPQTGGPQQQQGPQQRGPDQQGGQQQNPNQRQGPGRRRPNRGPNRGPRRGPQGPKPGGEN
jgi:hypothetical protein